MGGQGSTLLGADGGAKELDKLEFVSELGKACREENFERFKELWEQSWPHRRKRIDARDFDYDHDIVAADVLTWAKFGFRHRKAEWREAGVKAARTFLYMEEARRRLLKLDYLGALSLISAADDDEDPEADDLLPTSVFRKTGAVGREEEQAARNTLAIEIMCELAEFPEFLGSLCDTSVLNFLCIVLNQVPAAAEKVTQVFVKLSDREENLAVLMEGSIGDILESFVKTLQYKRLLRGQTLAQWKQSVSALGNSARTLGTMIKYGHQCQVQTETIIGVFSVLGISERGEDTPDNVRLLSELARLLYWICRSANDVQEKLYESSTGEATEDPDFVLQVLVKMWRRCVETHEMISGKTIDPRFLCDDLDRGIPLPAGSPGLKAKVAAARTLLCFMNCLLWLCLPLPRLRWKLQAAGFQRLDLALTLREPDLLVRVALSTIRHVVDLPATQQCHDLLRFFGDKLLDFLDLCLKREVPETYLRLILDGLSIVAMQRGMQEILAQRDIFATLKKVLDWARMDRSPDEFKKIHLVCLFTLAEVAAHPAHRLHWVSRAGLIDKPEAYPPREMFLPMLEDLVKDKESKFQTLASLLLTLLQESKFRHTAQEIAATFGAIVDWWQVNSTMHYEELLGAAHRREQIEDIERKPLPQLLQLALARREEQISIKSMETMRYCAPHECVIVLSLLSRLALEPKFKPLVVKVVEPLLGCICAGIWPEAREAAATIANLMWLPDSHEEHLVCWLRLDGPCCIALDAANVLMPVKTGEPRPMDLGTGMYRSTWGIEFVEDSFVTLHPDGLRTNQIPGLLTTASPLHTLANASCLPYAFLGSELDDRHFSVTTWFYWPSNPSPGVKVLIQTTPQPDCPSIASVYMERDEDGQRWVWILVDRKDVKRVVRTPQVQQGWHFMAIVSSSRSHPKVGFEGTKFFLDDWSVHLKQVWLPNDFYIVGNYAGAQGSGDGKKAFGLLTDFRIYAQPLADPAVHALAHASDDSEHPDKIVRLIASMDAATVLAQALDVPDCAAECLRALGSLATLPSQRTQIYSVCGRQAMAMLSSPYPMLPRQAARLLSNLS